MRKPFLIASALLLTISTFAVAEKSEPTTKPADAYPLTQCVISGEDLPKGNDVIVRQIENREVRFCCKECAEAFEKEPEANHRKMDEQIIEKTKDHYALETCLVSDEKLGGMGEPVMFVYRPTNQLVKFCCKGCVREFKADPAKFLPKLSAQK